MNLSVFRGVLEKSGHTGTCLWFEGKEPPQAIVFGEQFLDCTVIGRGEQLQVLSSGRRIGDAYAMRGWVGPKPEIIGWLAMIYSDKVA